MAYLLGYIVADGCIVVDKRRDRNPLTLNITSIEKKHLYRLRKVLDSDHKVSKKPGGSGGFAYQLQIRNPSITKNLIKLGIFPRKTYNLNPIKVPDKYFPDFVRGFFDGDGSVYIYKVNNVSQIKTGFVNPGLNFITEFNRQLCKNLNIPQKNIHSEIKKTGAKMVLYSIDFYIDDCERLYKYMYGNNPTLYLPRKRKVFEKWKTIKRRHYIKVNYPSKIGWYLNPKLKTR